MVVSSSAHADKIAHVFDVSLDVPKPIFYVLPVGPDWIHRSQYLEWNILNSTLGGLRKEFDVRNNSGAITAGLAGKPLLSNGIPGQEIALTVVFNGATLSEFAKADAVSAADANFGKRVLLEISPVKPASGYRPGNYFGSVHLLFNAVAPF